jgi:outer membrane protein assembly factor BamB
MPRWMLPVLALGLCGADWNQFRGPTQQGISDATKLPLEWDTKKNVSWMITVPGRGWSSPVVTNGMIVLTTAVESAGQYSMRVMAFRSATGEAIWDREVVSLTKNDLGKLHPKNSYASPSVIIEAGKVYAHFGHLGTARLSLKEGTIDWFTTELKYSPVHGNGGSPILFDGKVIFSIDGADRQEIVALDANTGKVAWRTPRTTKADRKFSFGTCTLAELHGQMQLISPGSDVVVSLDPKTGQELWRFAYKGYSIVPRPIVVDGIVYISTGYDSAKLLAIRPSAAGGDQTDSGLVWKADKNCPANPSMIVDGGLVYAVSDSGVASCWDAKSGDVIWSERVPDKYTSSLLLAKDRLYLQAEDGTGTVLKAGKSFEILATNKLAEKTLASYGVDGNALLIRTETKLYRVEEK